MNPFLYPLDDYQRDMDIVKGSIQQIAKHISLNLNKPMDECIAWVRAQLKPDGAFPLRDPRMTQLVKKRPGERVVEETTFLGYVEEILASGRIVSPSMVIYERPEVEKSVIAEWQDENIAARKKSKRRMLDLKQAGDIVGSQLADYDQNARKIRINSVSGMHGSKGNPIYLATGHSSLTSLCRAAAGYGNATVERFLAGARHYHNPEIVKANLVAMLTIEDKSRWPAIIEKYNITYPTVDEVMSMVERGSEFYWRNDGEMQKIRRTVEGMTDLERAICCYSGDMFHLAKSNPDLVRQMLSDLIANGDEDVGDVDTDHEFKTMNATDVAYVNALCAEWLMGKTHDVVREKFPEDWVKIGQVVVKVKRALAKWGDLINVVFAPKHLPPTVAHLKSIQRRAALAADTDSAIFTTEYWVEWYNGHLLRGPLTDRIWYLATYMTCQCIAHSLAMLSANVGVARDQIFRLAMKNEYGFPQFALTNLAKHYYSTMSMREGMIYEKPELEIKGVELRGSTVPKHILKAAEELMQRILTTLDQGKKLNAGQILHEVAEHELEAVRSIIRGEYTYLKSASIKPDTKNMMYHDLWQSVFAPKYGASVEPPYPAVRISTELGNKTQLKTWLSEIEDKDLAKRMADWLDKYNRKDLPSILLPYQAIRASGLPLEVQDAANVRKLAYTVNSGFYRILESTGLFLVDRNYRRLIYDFLGLQP